MSDRRNIDMEAQWATIMSFSPTPLDEVPGGQDKGVSKVEKKPAGVVVALPPTQYRNANINVVLGKQKLRRPRRFSKSSQGDGVRWLGLKTPINFCHNPKECTFLHNPGGKRRPIHSDNPDCHFLSSILSDLPKMDFGFYNTFLGCFGISLSAHNTSMFLYS